MAVVRLGAWCDFVTEDEYRHRLVKEGWPADVVENLVEDFKRGLSFVVHEFTSVRTVYVGDVVDAQGRGPFTVTIHPRAVYEVGSAWWDVRPTDRIPVTRKQG